MDIYEHGDTVRLSDGTVGLILRVWDAGATYDVGILDPEIPIDDEGKRRYDTPASEIRGRVKEITRWVDIPSYATMTTLDAEKLSYDLGHQLSPWQTEVNHGITQSVSICARKGCKAMAFLCEKGPEQVEWYLGRALTEKCEGL